MALEKEIFSRTYRLLGEELMENVFCKRVILFGVGGVGSWCAESLVRSGIEHLTIVDSDCVSITNVNRQLPATTRTVGLPKVDVLKSRLLEINPNAEITAINGIYEAAVNDSFHLEKFDYIIDAIDSLENKMQLLHHASKTKAKVFASMGAALKMDPTKIQVAEFWKVQGCPLARALRDKMKSKKIFLKKKVQCVFSDELLENRGPDFSAALEAPVEGAANWNARKAQINGTMAHATAIFGFTLAGLVMQDIYKGCTK